MLLIAPINMLLFSPFEFHRLESQYDWCTLWISVQKVQDVEMKLFESESGTLTQWPAYGGEIR